MREYEPELSEANERRMPDSPPYEDSKDVWDSDVASGLRGGGGRRKRYILRRVIILFAYPI